MTIPVTGWVALEQVGVCDADPEIIVIFSFSHCYDLPLLRAGYWK